MKFPVVDIILSQSSKLATGVEIKATGDEKVTAPRDSKAKQVQFNTFAPRAHVVVLYSS